MTHSKYDMKKLKVSSCCHIEGTTKGGAKVLRYLVSGISKTCFVPSQSIKTKSHRDCEEVTHVWAFIAEEKKITN